MTSATRDNHSMQGERQSSRSLRQLFLAAMMVMSQLLPTPAAADEYTIQDLGKDFIPISISDSSLIVGKDASSGTIITKRSNGTIVNNQFGQGSEATQINDNNFVVGTSQETTNPAALWKNGLISKELDNFTNLIKATAINGFNEIVGTRLDGSTSYRRPFHYDIFSGRLTTLGTLGGAEGWANDLNESGYMVGSSVDKSGNTRPFRYNSQVNTLAAIPTLEGYKHGEGWKINDDKSVVGWAFNDTRNQAGKRAFYNSLSGNMANLGTLGKDTDSVAKGINNHGLIVGQSLRADDNGQAFLFNTTSADVVIVVVDPDMPTTVYAHSTKGSGIMKSTDKGQNWQTINNGLTNKSVNALLIDTSSATKTLYAGTSGGIFTSADGGNNWALLSGALDETLINALYIVTDTNGRNGRLFAGTNGGIYYSDDKGANWTLGNSSTGFSSYNFVSDISRPNTVYAATSRGVYASTDRGRFWSRQNGQNTTQLLSQRVSALAIDPNDTDTIYAGTIGGGVFRADIAAGSLQWTAFNDNLVNMNIYTLLFYDDGATSTLFAGSTGGLHQREIGDATWTPASNYGNNRGAYSLALSTDGGTTTLYASSFDGDVFRSDSSGGTPAVGSSWTSITRGVSLAAIYTLTTIRKDGNDPTSQTHILAGANNGFFKLSYKNPGDSTRWSAPISGGGGLKLTAISHDSRTTPYTLWAGSSDQGVLISHDNGDTWSASNEGLDNWNVSALAVDTTPATPIVFAATMGGVYRSDDGGRHWSKASDGLNNSPVYSLLLDSRVTPALLYAGTKEGVYRSGDYGRFWVPLNTNIENSEIVTLLRTQGDTLLAGSISGGLFISSNSGQSWSVNNGATVLPIFDLAEDPFAPNSILAATTKGLHRLDCDPLPCIWGASFLSEQTVNTVRFDPDNANHIYAGTETQSVQVSTNLGNSWQTFEAGITNVTNRMENLNKLLKPETVRTNWDLQEAVDINNNGEIIGWGYKFDDHGVKLGKYGYLLTSVTGSASVDLVVTQVTQPDTIKQGIPFNFQIAITNLGPGTETSAKLIDWLPPDIIFRVVSTSVSTRKSNPGFCEKRPENIVRCELGAIQAGETVYVNISMESPYRDVQIHNIASVKGNERDINPDNNTTTSGNTVTIDKCFIATAAYGSFLDPHVTALRAFRDNHLLTTPWGREFVTLYYRYSPPIANFISDSAVLRGVTRLLLAPIVYAVLYPLLVMVLMIAAIAGLIYFRQHKRGRQLRAA